MPEQSLITEKNISAHRAQSAPFVIPIFISHQGCPHQCIFCNQSHITGIDRETTDIFSAFAIEKRIKELLAWPRKHPDREIQVAFYGGSFTGLAKNIQEELLGAVQPFIHKGLVDSIRLSTRPDYIDSSTAVFLNQYHVKIVELGVQSMVPEVLKKTNRGHTVEQIYNAVHHLRAAGGLQIGAQIMVGLPGETTVGLVEGAECLAQLAPDFARIYPTLVVKGSGLAGLYNKGEYRPMSINKAVALTARLKTIFDRHSIPVIRMGLQPTDSLTDNVLAGPYHQAFGELVYSRLMYKKIRTRLWRHKKEGGIKIQCAAADQSIVRGHKNHNMKRLFDLGLLKDVTFVFDSSTSRNSVIFT